MHHVPAYLAIGSPEEGSKWYYEYVSCPKPENRYSFDHGDAHFAIIDSSQDLSPQGEQYQWLDRDLGSAKGRWKFVALHHPPYSSGENESGDKAWEPSRRGDPNARKLVPLFEKHGVDVVWAGHIHDYERSWPIREGKVQPAGGVVYIQTGGGGVGVENLAPGRSWFTAKIHRGSQYCLATVQGGTLRITAYGIDGGMFDFLEIVKP